MRYFLYFKASSFRRFFLHGLLYLFFWSAISLYLSAEQSFNLHTLAPQRRMSDVEKLERQEKFLFYLYAIDPHFDLIDYLNSFENRDKIPFDSIQASFRYFLNLGDLFAESDTVIADRYRLKGLLGWGVHRYVYKIYDFRLKLFRALKVSYTYHGLTKGKYSSEKEVAGKLLEWARNSENHENIIVPVSTSKVRGKDELERLLILTEYIEMDELYHWQLPGKPIVQKQLSNKDRLEAVIQVVDALRYLVSRGLLLFDPQLSLTREKNRTKVTLFDFSFSILKNDKQSVDEFLEEKSELIMNPGENSKDQITVLNEFQRQWIIFFLKYFGQLKNYQQDLKGQVSAEEAEDLHARFQEYVQQWRSSNKDLRALSILDDIIVAIDLGLSLFSREPNSIALNRWEQSKMKPYADIFYQRTPDSYPFPKISNTSVPKTGAVDSAA